MFPDNRGPNFGTSVWESQEKVPFGCNPAQSHKPTLNPTTMMLKIVMNFGMQIRHDFKFEFPFWNVEFLWKFVHVLLFQFYFYLNPSMCFYFKFINVHFICYVFISILYLPQFLFMSLVFIFLPFAFFHLFISFYPFNFLSFCCLSIHLLQIHLFLGLLYMFFSTLIFHYPSLSLYSGMSRYVAFLCMFLSTLIFTIHLCPYFHLFVFLLACYVCSFLP